MSYDLQQNISSLTQLNPNIVKRLSNLTELCICDYVFNTIEQDEDVVEIDIGIGMLYINIMDDEIEYNFIPSSRLEKRLIKTFDVNESPLVKEAEKNLNKKIVSTYKELL